MRNAVQRRNHKERAQPLERKKWGLLEKHKDYSKRAADHNLKKRKIKALQQKAGERNEDEFYFGMVNASTSKGVKRAKRGEENSGGGGKALTDEVVRLMKTQDEGYLRTMLQSTRKDRERVEEEVLRGEVGVRVKVPEADDRRLVFDEDGEAPAGSEGMVDDGLLPEMDDLDGFHFENEQVSEESESEPENLSKEERAARRRRKHGFRVKERQLQGLQNREAKLSSALRQVEEQRARMSGTVGGVNKSGIKFKARQRKR
ncbi:hypothetical protein B0A50_00673 [Salinomyces thailandicus]|uniref:U3 small nucleolar RNA-associated protein 11 n=1 Tax=Salinomyces thailandicus TaxID=706561 RepID=A0A4U0UCA9_9PEZI|nr:hypothetical protein B0A50_00673 [Salinomyces thailandica]